ncbi:MAG: hypothetical protein ACP5MZ_02950 [Candidatus Micrarchaeia archaeon]
MLRVEDMDRHELAEGLKKRQLDKAETLVIELNKGMHRQVTVPQFRDAVISSSDDEIIMDYLTCSVCGAPLLPYNTDIDAMVKSSSNAEEWLDKTSEAMLKHECTHNK